MTVPETPLLALLAGLVLLVAGRRLFWLFVGLVGFITVYRWLEPRWLLALLAGLLGIVLAIFLQRVAIAAAGFFAGGWFAVQLFGFHMANPRGSDLLIFVVAGVIAAILSLALFDLALVILSSLAGADLIVGALHPRPGVAKPLLLVLAAVGIAVQMGITARRRRTD
jgi:small-conductance mechanosensitive channel